MLIGTTLTMPIPIQYVFDVQTVLLKKKNASNNLRIHIKTTI